MPYVGGSLRSLFDQPQRDATTDAMRSMADRAIQTWKDATVKATPVDTGALKQSWYTVGPEAAGEVIESSLRSDIDYAPHVEFGTGLYGPKAAKYPILPKKPGGFLHWVDPATGKDVFARKVMHPGSPGAYMLTKGANATSAAISAGLFEVDLKQWQQTVVRQAD